MTMHDDIMKVLVSEEELKAKVAELGAQISRDYEGKNLVLKHKTTSSMTACKWYAPPLPLEWELTKAMCAG